MLRNIVAIGVRLHKPPSEILDLSVQDYELLMAHFSLEQADSARSAATAKAQNALAQRRR